MGSKKKSRRPLEIEAHNLPTERLRPAFSRVQMHAYFLDKAGKPQPLSQLEDGDSTAAFKAFVEPIYETFLQGKRPAPERDEVKEYWESLIKQPTWDTVDRWYLLHLLTRSGICLPIYKTPEEALREARKEKTTETPKTKGSETSQLT